MIFYFSGTGNSRLAAEQIGAALGDEVVSINQRLKAGGKSTFHSERPLVFVAPTYAWRLPKIVEHWIEENDFTGHHDAYVVLTCGDGCGNAAAYARSLCRRKGFSYRGLAAVVMPENYLAMFQTPDRTDAQEIITRAIPRIAELAAAIRAGKPFSEAKPSFIGRLESGPVNPLFYRFWVSDRGFSVSNACVSCGKCARRCPLNNIEMTSGKPVWKGNCTHCMACIGGCPVEAVEYKNKSKGRSRYYIIMED